MISDGLFFTASILNQALFSLIFILTGGIDTQRFNLTCPREADGVTSFLIDFGKAEAVFRRISISPYFQSNPFAFRVFYNDTGTDRRE